ncbi:HD domain-containing phosphohydrolase [Chitinibacter tainanensis]|uniref:HD domain-containing phosphohydrolase n=1 Tax=Chitinibacter tainanensis TaxID=230667 RepID=UPI00235230E1|nr:HD domain-containing phosphohydrolase [Chitinibacter tainanensis]
MSQARATQVPFYIHISYLFVGLLLSFALLSSWQQYQTTTRMLKQTADQQFRLAVESATEEIREIYHSGARSSELMAQHELMRARTLDERLQALPYLVASLRHNPILTAQYIGYDTGDFFMVRTYGQNKVLQQRFQPPVGTEWIVQSITYPQGQLRGEYLFFDQDLHLLEQRVDERYRFDPRLRDWYQVHGQPQTLKVTAPYFFASSGQTGITFSRLAANHKAVVGSDVRLERINTFLLRHKITPDTRLALLDSQQRVLASQKGVPELTRGSDGQWRLPELSHYDPNVLLSLLGQQTGHAGSASTFANGQGEQWEGMVQPLRLPGMPDMTLAMATPHAELMADAVSERNRGILVSLGLLAFGVLMAIWLSHKASRPINALSDEVQKIEQFQFDEPLHVRSNIREIARLADGLGSMKQTIHRFMSLSQALASERNFGQLLARILNELGAVSLAEGGVIFITSADGQALEAAQYFWQGPAQPADEHSQLIALASEHAVASALREGETLCRLSPAQFTQDFPLLPATERELTQLTLPLRNRDGALVGVLALALDEAKRPSAELLAFVETIAATAAVAVDTQRLINEQKTLLEAFIQLIAGAIDAKSPYTGGHCQRVPELTKMLARAAERQTQGPFAGFSLSEAQWEELHIAAWLHDCGKVTTPEYVVDKATKLETLYDRIHEVRMRFEVLKRDAELAYWQGVAAGGDVPVLQAELAAQLAALDDDFAFVAACNEGGEFMAPEKITRLQQIAQRTWRRTLSDRVGIAHEEKQRKARSPEPALPVLEPLLADRPEHLIERGAREQLAADNPWGFKVNVPEALYNRGELYNLSVARGTLSSEERYKINEHIIQTIIMLEKLPFPRHLRQVPEIAGGHHEKMDGTGYPKRLRREEMSVPARMMAMADIFEALTAVDRPYKKGKTLSEALKIMSFMVKDQHIDAELFALFLQEGIYRQYAERFMQAEQIDEVDIQQYMPA